MIYKIKAGRYMVTDQSSLKSFTFRRRVDALYFAIYNVAGPKKIVKQKPIKKMSLFGNKEKQQINLLTKAAGNDPFFAQKLNLLKSNETLKRVIYTLLAAAAAYFIIFKML